LVMVPTVDMNKISSRSRWITVQYPPSDSAPD
jgi:hypothetical protein